MTNPPVIKPQVVVRFEAKLKSVQGIYHRIDKGLNTGRNSTSTDATLDYRMKELRAMISADETEALCSWLDEHPKLAERWNKIERRYYGL